MIVPTEREKPHWHKLTPTQKKLWRFTNALRLNIVSLWIVVIFINVAIISWLNFSTFAIIVALINSVILTAISTALRTIEVTLYPEENEDRKE